MAKLNVKIVRSIRALYNRGIYLQKELAVMYNVDSRTISSVIKRKHWKWVD